MFIQTQIGATEQELEFFPGQGVIDAGAVAITAEAADEQSPLAVRLYAVEGVRAVTLQVQSILVSKSEDKEWAFLRTEVFSAIMAHYESGDPAVTQTEDAGEFDVEIVAQVKDLLETRIVPAVTQSGGDVAFHSYVDGTLYLKMQGSAFTMLTGITNMLKHYIPELQAVVDHREALPRPGLQSSDGVAIRDLLKDRINPSIASHGGYITLVDVKENTAYLRLEGGCQGCGMADVTLKQGVAKEIMEQVPAITEVLDVTDHAGGSNPYYRPN